MTILEDYLQRKTIKDRIKVGSKWKDYCQVFYGGEIPILEIFSIENEDITYRVNYLDLVIESVMKLSHFITEVQTGNLVFMENS